MINRPNNYAASIFSAGTAPDKVVAVQQFRKKLFVDNLGWSLATQGDREVDAFDTSRSVYAALFDGGEIVGTFRAIRSDEPYLAESVFPNLAVTRNYPKSVHCFEISRFGIFPGVNARRAAATLYALMFHFALLRRLKSLVAVTDLFHERYLASKNIRTRRFGIPQTFVQDADNQSFTLVAGEIPIAAQNGVHLQALLANLNGVTIHDETLVFGRQSISA